VLAARSGLLRIDEAHDELAVAAALMDLRAGRAWRSLHDAGLSAYALYEAEGPWTSLRRGTDFYREGALVWLEVDATIRARSRGRRSLDDFARAFFAPPAGSTPGMDEPLAPVPYERADIVAALAAIEPYDWATFFADRIDRPTARTPLGGIEQAGFRLAYRDSVTPYVAAYEGLTEKVDLRFALGVRIDGEGAIDAVIPESPAGRAGLAPGEVVVAVNDRAYAEPVLRDALIATGRDSTARFDLLVRSATFFRTVSLSGVRGDRRPALLRLPGAADGLGAILAPRTGRPRRR
jgi:predicted metalloprotease with PDZ domain